MSVYTKYMDQFLKGRAEMSHNFWRVILWKKTLVTCTNLNTHSGEHHCCHLVNNSN